MRRRDEGRTASLSLRVLCTSKGDQKRRGAGTTHAIKRDTARARARRFYKALNSFPARAYE